ncbi:hypothetical protein QR680_002090 [Steinernema hermaphroditum]|uniref:NUDE domain-containing protein n=1 Tax=Steinernema hermaphroditum TaxID=289476 RepID=A0AA39LHE9_9BILA|nr:hypothetical protein QR680_002090 [Steinernema hermaphroditum]
MIPSSAFKVLVFSYNFAFVFLSDSTCSVDSCCVLFFAFAHFRLFAFTYICFMVNFTGHLTLSLGKCRENELLSEMSNNNTEVMELEFYKKEVCRLQELLEKEQKDFDEYQTDSRDLEETLTREIDDLKAEKAKLLRNIDLQKSQQKAQSERHDRERRDLLLNEQRLTKLLEEKRAECEELTNTVRKLETQNESLERSQRTGMQELSDLSDKLNTALERVVLVESELTETSDQNEEFQRLKEENNYLREELEEAKKSSSSNSVNGSETPESCICEMRNATNTINKIDSHSKPHKRNVLPLIKDPISVIIKMNQIVRDLLLKVDEMENKMARLNSTNASTKLWYAFVITGLINIVKGMVELQAKGILAVLQLLSNAIPPPVTRAQAEIIH